MIQESVQTFKPMCPICYRDMEFGIAHTCPETQVDECSVCKQFMHVPTNDDIFACSVCADRVGNTDPSGTRLTEIELIEMEDQA